jgi:multiple sugar transport system permease protein
MKRVSYWLLLVGLILVQELPLLWMLSTALRPETGFLLPTSTWREITLSNFGRLITSTNFLRWCLNSVMVSVVSAGTAAVLGNLFALSLRFVQMRVYRHVRNLVLAAYVVPSMFLVLPIQWGLASFPRLASLFFLPLIYQVFLLPVCVWIGSSYVDRIPLGVIAMARLEHLDMWSAIRLVYIPYAGRALWVSFALSLVLSMQEYVYGFLLLSDQHWHTLPVGIAALQAGDIYQWSLIAAAGVVCSLIAIMILISCNRLLFGAMTRVFGRAAGEAGVEM